MLGRKSEVPQGNSAGAQLEVADGADEKSDAEGKNILTPELLSSAPLLRLVDLLLQSGAMKSQKHELNSFVLVSHLHLSYLVLRRSRLLLFLPSFKFHLPERWSVVTFFDMPNFVRTYLFLSSSFCSVRMILLGD